MTTQTHAPRVYLAGPEVFLPNARAIGVAKVKLCAAHGLHGLFPLDQSLDLQGLSPGDQARAISLANEDLMRSADAIIANLTPFRGVSMDCGTAFEVGFMRALGRPVFAYTNDADAYRDRCERFRTNSGTWRDGDRPHYQIEDFGLAENLMIDVAVSESGLAVVRGHERGADMAGLGAFESCLAAAADVLKKSR